MFDRGCRAPWAAAMLLAGLLAGCAMERPAPRTPEPAAEEQPPAEQEPTQAPATPSPAGPTAGSAKRAETADHMPAFDDLLDQLSVAEGIALSAGRDCGGACKALKSMEKAASGICSLSPRADSTGRCRSAEDRVRNAREKVRSACGQCADGTSVDPNAPLE